MAEPNSCVLKVKIARSRLDAYLAAKPLPASLWTDWAEIGGDWFDWKGRQFDLAEEMPRLLAEADADLLKEDTYLSFLRGQYPFPIQAQRIEYDNVSNTFLAADLASSEHLNEIIVFLAAARGITKYMNDDDSGFAIVHDYLWSETNVAAISLMPSQSRFLNQNAYVDQYEAAIRDGVAVIDRLARDGAARDGGPFDDPPSVREEYERKLSQRVIESFCLPTQEG